MYVCMCVCQREREDMRYDDEKRRRSQCSFDQLTDYLVYVRDKKRKMKRVNGGEKDQSVRCNGSKKEEERGSVRVKVNPTSEVRENVTLFFKTKTTTTGDRRRGGGEKEKWTDRTTREVPKEKG